MTGRRKQTRQESSAPPVRAVSPGRHLRWVALAGGVCALAFLAACRASGAGRQKTQSLKLTDIGGYVEFVARQREHSQESKAGGGTLDEEEMIFEENVRLDTDGFAYHPNLMEFALGGLFGLVQHDYRENVSGRERTSGDNGTAIEFDFDASFLKKKKYPGNVFAHRQRTLEPRPFNSSLETTTTDYGLVWQYISEKVPTSFRLSHTDVRLDPLNSVEEEGLQKNTSARFETAYKFNQQNELSLLYERQSVEEQPFELQYDSDEATLGHHLRFGGRNQHRLESELNYFYQRGTYNIERFRWREILRLDHTDELRSWYRFELLDRTQGGFVGVAELDERRYTLSATIEHELYDSLVSQFHAFGLKQEFGAGLEINRIGALASFDYRKDNRWGRLLATYRATIQHEERTGVGLRVGVVDEQHTFMDPEPIVLVGTRIETGSIVITAEDRVTLYHAGRDFNLFLRGDWMEIERVPTGRILDGQTVLVDYVYHVGGDYDLDTINQDFRVRQEFNFGLSPYYQLRWQDQTITPAWATGSTPEDITGHVFGMEYRWRSLRLVAEYEDRDSTISAFEAIRLSADYTHRFKFGATGTVKVRWSDMSYKPPDERETTFFTAEGRYRHMITSGLTVEGAVLYRTEEDSLSGDDEGVDVDFSLEWFVRQTEVRVTYEYGMFEDDFASSDQSSLFVQVRRRF
ncbi:MAG: hypothetical protein GY842_22410 [bacterium]|nr:hypothetical protein [bacterium]